MQNIEIISEAIKQYVHVKKKFRELNITNSERQLVSEIAQWFVEKLYYGERADSSIQSDWDIKTKNKTIQVKGHAKSDSNRTRWTEIDYREDADIDELIIIVFTKDLSLREFYKAPWKEIQKYIKRENIKHTLKWDDLSLYKIEAENLPNQKIVELFK